jgi:predicted nucleotidyltransferase
MDSAVAKNRDEILEIAERHGAKDVRIFGSVARGEDTKQSDLDLLVKLDEDRSLVDHVALKQDLENLLGCEIDIVTENSINPRLREKVFQDAVPI